MATVEANYSKASQKTATTLKTIATSSQVAALSRLTLPEIEQITEQIAQIVPAGNVPGLILSGLARLEGRQVPPAEQQRHLGMLFRGVRDILDKAVYGAMFAGPAAVIMGYQKLLELAGKDVEAAFPDGVWQFYLEFALREDTARHANETTAFQGILLAHQISITEADALTAWIMAALLCIQNYERLLENEWRERIYTTLLKELLNQFPLPDAKAALMLNAYTTWERQRPYIRGQDAGNEEDYPAYRRRKFDSFIQSLLVMFGKNAQSTFALAAAEAERENLPAYLRQMSILANLEPGPYQEFRAAYPLDQANIGIVYNDAYVCIPVLGNNKTAPYDVRTLRAIASAILASPAAVSGSDLDLLLVGASRTAQASIRSKAGAASQESLVTLTHTPIIINWDRRDAQLPLALIRQGRRGIGDHALTLFFTDESTIFDQSHIFFDGAWGAALAEIMTGEALAWALYLAQLPPATPLRSSVTRLTLTASTEVREAVTQSQLPAESSAESTGSRLKNVLALRRLLKMRSDLVNVTVNDLLILYRTIHGQRYTPSSTLVAALDQLQADPRPPSRDIYQAIAEAIKKAQSSNPAILIPMDASQAAPHVRLHPTTFRNPMTDLYHQHTVTLEALYNYKNAPGNRQTFYAEFDDQQRQYLRMIGAFGDLMRKHKEVAMSGQSISTMSIKLLAHMPDVMQRLLDRIPGQFDVLNEIIKGEEVFSNVGRVAQGSSLRRFITAKDDNQQKTLAWGVVTDDQDVLHISLRDFRPHVTLLAKNNMPDLAMLITQDFLDAYVDGFNLFVRELREITVASRETRLNKEDLPKDDKR